MGAGAGRVAALLGLYMVLTLGPLAVALAGDLPDPRGFWVEFSCALGFVGLAMMAVQFTLTARFHWLALRFGQDSMLQFHRQAGLVAFVFVLAHPIIALVAEPSYIEFFDPRVNLPRAGALSFVLVALVLVVAMPFWRLRLGVPYEWWRVTHGMLAFAVVGIGLAHVLMVGQYVATLWKQAVWIGLTAAAMGLFAHVRLVKPFAMRRRPWRVAAVRPENARTWTVALEADGHDGLAFHPGQFAWLTLGESPFTLQQHPFTISSSADRRDIIELTIKALGDFTATIRHVRKGARAWLEGPYGDFTSDRAPDAAGFVLVAGGIGVTPAISILRTMRDRGDRRPVVLIYAAPEAADLIFAQELRELGAALALRTVCVLEQPAGDELPGEAEGWTLEPGMVTPALLARHVPAERRREYQYFICGPEPMMDAVEQTLLELDIPRGHVHSERFNIA